MNSEVQDLLKSLDEYLPKLENGGQLICELLQQENEEEAYPILVMYLEGLEWTLSAIEVLGRYNAFPSIDMDQVKDKLIELEGEMTVRNTVAIGDILSYELSSIVQSWREQLLSTNMEH